MRVVLADPPAYTPPYDRSLAAALAGAGAEVELVTSRFRFGTVAAPSGYSAREWFYPLSSRLGSSRARLAVKALEHPFGMARLATLKPVKVVYGPGTFANASAGEINDQLQARVRGKTAEADQAAKAARKVAAAQGKSPAEQRHPAERTRCVIIRRGQLLLHGLQRAPQFAGGLESF